MSRCMSDEMMQREYPDEKQRAAVCNSQYERKEAAGGGGAMIGGGAMLWAIWPNAIETIDPESFFVLSEELEVIPYAGIDDNGIATVSVMGPIGRRMGDMCFQGVDSDRLTMELNDLARDPNVRGVLLHIDSPGGIVSGTREVSQAVANIGKPIIAYTDGMAASAAYWIASAADVVMASVTAQIGSIGVVATHVDRSKALANAGLRITHIFSGSFKTAGVDSEPLTDEAKDYIQTQVDIAYGIFANDISRHRSMSATRIQEMESKIYFAEQAEQEGLIDGIGSITEAYKQLQRSAGIMNLNELQTEFPGLYQEALALGKQSMTAEDAKAAFPDLIVEAMRLGAETERKRNSEIREAAFPGQSELVERLIAFGASPDEALKQLMADQKAKMIAGLAVIAAGDVNVGANPEPETGHADATDATDAGNKLAHIAERMMREQGLNFETAFGVAKSKNPKLVEAYLHR